MRHAQPHVARQTIARFGVRAVGAGQRAFEARRPRRGVVAELNHMSAETILAAILAIIYLNRGYLNSGTAEIHLEPRLFLRFTEAIVV